jgi:Tfp pilus assembly protein PilO
MNRRERVMLMVAIVLLGGIIFKYLIHDPQQAQYETLVTARDAAAAELAKDEQIVARAEQARAEYERIRAHIATVEQKLPQQKEIPALLTAMEQFTKKIGVVLQSIRPGPLTAVAATPAATRSSTASGGTPAASSGAPAASGGAPAAGGAVRTNAAGTGQAPASHTLAYSSMPVDISLVGTFGQIVDYLREMRDFPRLVIVNSVALSPQTLPKLGVTIRAQIYTLGVPSGQTGGAH